jgi:hypothetical protein
VVDFVERNFVLDRVRVAADSARTVADEVGRCIVHIVALRDFPLLRKDSSRDSDFDTDQVTLHVSRREDGILTQSARMLRFPAV